MPRNIETETDFDDENAPPAWMDDARDAIFAEYEAGERPATKLAATPFTWRDESLIPPRKWLYGRHLLRKFLSVDVAAGGVGKSSLKIGEALAMTTGRELYGKEIGDGPLRVWLYNLEDPMEETERRLHATAKHFRITPGDIGDRLFVDSGRDQPCVIAEETPNGARIATPVVEEIIRELTERQIDVLILDPFVSSHAVSENDNRAMDMVAKQWARIADICDCSINLVHHVRKQNGTEATADSARGAKALVDAARSVLVYNRMTSDEAAAANIPPEQSPFFFRTTNDKANLSPAEKADWHRMNNVDLDNGDKVGVACPFQWPDLFDGVSMDKIIEVQQAIGAGKYRADSRSADWVGNIISTTLGMDPTEDGSRKRATKMIREWMKTGTLIEVEQEDQYRKVKKFVEVGKWLTK